ncbi:MAG: hypothetical protein ACOCP8_08490 [archaeon]
MDNEEIIKKILNSTYLKSIYIYAVKNKYFMQKDIIHHTPIKYPGHLSQSLKELRIMKLIKLENPNDKNYKRYQTTKKAYILQEEIEKYGNLD